MLLQGLALRLPGSVTFLQAQFTEHPDIRADGLSYPPPWRPRLTGVKYFRINFSSFYNNLAYYFHYLCPTRCPLHADEFRS